MSFSIFLYTFDNKIAMALIIEDKAYSFIVSTVTLMAIPMLANRQRRRTVHLFVHRLQNRPDNILRTGYKDLFQA